MLIVHGSCLNAALSTKHLAGPHVVSSTTATGKRSLSTNVKNARQVSPGSSYKLIDTTGVEKNCLSLRKHVLNEDTVTPIVRSLINDKFGK